MPQNQRKLRLVELSVRDMQVGAADAAGMHADEQFVRTWRGDRDF
jgi:hypothetical protein